MQKTNFSYEILIHNDASTDDTGEIIQEYIMNHPGLIREIRQKTNQYQAGNRAIITKFLLPEAKGDLIALCEGDDYWTDPFKLQRQVEILDKNSALSVCIHGAKVIGPDGETSGHYRAGRRGRMVKVTEVIGWHHNFCPTCSIVYRKQHMETYPDYCLKCHVGDFPLMLWLSLKGSVYFLNREMSVYRKGIPQSWTESYINSSMEKRLEGVGTEIEMLDGIDRESSFKYKREIRKKKSRLIIYTLWRYRAIKQLRRPEYLHDILRLPFYKSIRILFLIYFTSYE